MNLNKAIIAGNLVRDPETRTLPSGQNVVNFSVATNRIWNDDKGNRQQAVEFHNVVAFGKLADICSQYLAKGRLVLIEGRLQTRSWQDQQGVKKYRTEIIANNMQMGPRYGSAQTAPSASTPANPVANQISSQTDDIPVIDVDEAPSPAKESEPENDEKQEVNVEDIPF